MKADRVRRAAVPRHERNTREEAVLNPLWITERLEGREGRVVEALPHEDVLELPATHRRLER
jgi:hypothetical protein